VTAHALRHTAASLAISAGASPQGGAADARACQRGHDVGRVRRFVRVWSGRGCRKCVQNVSMVGLSAPGLKTSLPPN